MPSDPTTGLVILPRRTDTSIGALASQTGIDLDTAYATTTTKTFLMKQLVYELAWQTGTVTNAGSLVVALCHGSITNAEAITIINSTLADPTDVSNWDAYGQSNGVLWDSLRMLSDDDHGNGVQVLSEKISVGGRSGIPYNQEGGWRVFAYNPGSGAIVTGTGILGIIQYRGVWLDD